MIRNILLFVSALTYMLSTNAQCIADAGVDKHSCPDDPDAHAIPIGGTPTASSGTPPYTYSWTIEPIEFAPGSSFPYLYASDILDDTTAANPSIIYRNLPVNPLTFYVTISYSLGCISTDSCIVSFTGFSQHFLYHHYWIDPGDSVYLNQQPNIGGGFGSVIYEWNPSYGLIGNTTLPGGFFVKPDTSTNYTPTVIDSKGCRATAGGPLYFIHVRAVGIGENKSNSPLKLYPNPTSAFIYIETDANVPIQNVNLFNMNGQELNVDMENKNSLNVEHFPEGVYILEVQINDELIRHQFVKE